MTRTMAAALALAAAGCGNYSTEDLRFLAALPTREDLRVAVPAQGSAAGALTLDPCPAASTADEWRSAKDTSDELNRGVSFIISFIDVVRQFPPTERGEDFRRWGPFPDEKHPGHEIQILLGRSYPAGPEGPPLHRYRFEARPVAAPTFEPVIVGTFEGASSARGSGTVVLDFDAIQRAGIADDDTPPAGLMVIQYDRVSEPATIGLLITNEGFVVVPFAYGYAGWRDGRGAFYFRFRNSAGDVLTVATSFGAPGYGRAVVAYDPANPLWPPGSFDQCWDTRACLTYVRDPANFSCPAHASCSFGTEANCPTAPDQVPIPLF